MLLQEDGSGAGSPPREQNSVYDAETEPSANTSSALADDADEATQQRPAAGARGTGMRASTPQVPHTPSLATCAGLCLRRSANDVFMRLKSDHLAKQTGCCVFGNLGRQHEGISSSNG